MKIFASDYDGTIKINGEVSKENLEMLKRWKDVGNKFGIVSGRSVESTMQEIEKYHYNLDFMICNNGGVIYNKDGELLKAYEISFEKAMELIEDIKLMDCNSYVVNDGYHRAKAIVNSDYEDFKYGSYSSDYTVQKIIEKKRICQIVISLNNNDLGKQLASEINKKYGLYVAAFPNVNCVDIVPSGVDKATGLKFIEDYYGYTHDDIYVMGDSYNDLPMLNAYQGATLNDTFDDIKKEVNKKVDDVASFLKELL